MKLAQCYIKKALVKILSWCFQLRMAELKQVWKMNE